MQTAYGAASLAATSDDTPTRLREQVTSPNGTTAAALEVLMGILICSLGVEAAVHRHTTTLPVLVSLSLIGFLGSVSVARFVRKQDAPVSQEVDR
mgnify:CR=1 FL=1